MDDSSASPSSLPAPAPSSSVGELSAEFAKQKRPKSPPLAFEKTPNDALLPPNPVDTPNLDGAAITSPDMGRLSPLQGHDRHLQVVIDQQGAAIQLLHDAFAAERQAWSLERDRLYQRIASLEKLLKTGDGYSPAKSPVLSPLNHSNYASPQSKSAAANRLPSIAEDESLPPPLSRRRGHAPESIDIPSAISNHHRSSENTAVSFESDPNSDVKVEEIPVPPSHQSMLSPPPLENRREAGHTPIRVPRPLTPPPQNSLSMDGIEDTPTRNNTHINTFLTRSNDEEEDKTLHGPLHMPELPNKPDEGNFTFDALSKRLEQIEKDPEQCKPTIFADPSPGMASPVEQTIDKSTSRTISEENPPAPIPTRMNESSASELSSNALSSAALSPLARNASRDQVEDEVQAAFENGGIKLKKKPSSNFGAPFGSLGGFGAGRKVSQDWQ